MRKETQFLCIILLLGLAISLSGCGIRPAKLTPPSEVDQKDQTEPKPKAAEFPAIYPKAAR